MAIILLKFILAVSYVECYNASYMEIVSDEHFQALIDKAFDSLPKTHRDRVQNVAILFADEPTLEQREELQLRHDQTLLGLYQGIPLSRRQGQMTTLPDRITLFKFPLPCKHIPNKNFSKQFGIHSGMRLRITMV